jgi:hypothetical protein
MSAASVASASAHEWLLNGAAITTATKIHSKGLLLLEDTATATRVHCKGFDSGTVGPGAADLVETITAELLGTNDLVPCTFDKTGVCESGTAPKALAVNLPWRTEIYSEGAETRDMITPDGAGSPGWRITCKVAFLGLQTDECTVALGSTGMANVVGGVNTIFDEVTPRASCSKGNATSGIVTGTVLQENPSGKTLTFF